MGGLYYDAPHRVTADVGKCQKSRKKNYFFTKTLINEQFFR